MSSKAHWDAVFRKKQGDEVSWYQPHLLLSTRLFARAGVSTESKVIDIGGGVSTLVDDLLAEGVQDVTVLDFFRGFGEGQEAAGRDRCERPMD